jgi:tetratricopeptide (TPR) repeat protein
MIQAMSKLKQKAFSFYYLLLVLTLTHSILRQVENFELLVYDDLEHIVYNPAVSAATERPDLASIWRKPYFDLYVPVAYTTWALIVHQATSPAERRVDPLQLRKNQALSTALHRTNLYLHETSTGLIFLLLLLLGSAPSGAAVGSLVFALHPIQVESVAWISEGRGLLATALGLGALTLWMMAMKLYANKSGRGSNNSGTIFWLAMALAWCLYGASILAKPSTVILPAIALTLATLGSKVSYRRVCLWLIPWILVSIGAASWTAYLQKDLVSPWPWWERGLLATDSFIFYLKQILWPSTFLPDYGREPILAITHVVLLMIAGMLSIGLMSLFIRKKLSPHIVVTALVFTLGLSPHLGLFPSFYQSLSTVADRYSYLAMLGIAYGLAFGWTWSLENRANLWSRSLFVVLPLWLGILVYKTILYLPLWQRSQTLFEYNLEHFPGSFTASHALGDLSMIERDVKKAAKFYRQAIQARPQFAQGYASLGHALLEDQKPEEAKVALMQATTINSQHSSALLNLGVSLQRTGDLSAAKEKYLAVNALAPHHLAFFNLGSIYLQQKNLEQAEEAFKSALLLDPRLHQAHLKLAEICERKGRLSERDQHLQSAASIRQNP